MPNKYPPGSIWIHAEGGHYVIMGKGKFKNEISGQWMESIVYTPLIGNGISVRPFFYIRTVKNFRERFKPM